MINPDKKLNVLAILPESIAGRLIVASIADGFQQLGHNVKYFDVLRDSDFLSFFNQNDFDLMTSYDYSALKLKIENNLDIKCINYFGDLIESATSGPGWDKLYENLKDESSFTFYWDEELTRRKDDIKNLWYMPHFVNCDVYKNLGIEKEYDIMFAGRLDTEHRLNFFIDLMLNMPDKKFAWYAIDRHYQDALKRTEYPDLITKAYKGFIDNEHDMAVAINKSRFVYNINAQGITSLNYRTIQVMACEVVCLSDLRQELNLFKGDVPFYTNLEDLIGKIKYFEENPAAYNYTAKASRNWILKNHNAKDCVAKMLQVI